MFDSDFDFDFPPIVKGKLLDEYLANGWYRHGSILHTLDSVWYGDNKYPVVWLRYNVNAVKLSRSNRHIIARNSKFHCSYRRLELNEEIEALHRKYRKYVPFDTAGSLAQILVDTSTFDSYVIEVRHKGKLIAVGMFDAGLNSIAGIVCCYDPLYRQYSLGKYLILLMYQHCVRNGYHFFYPGYHIPGIQLMSYKLFLDRSATELYLRNNKEWVRLMK